MFLSIPDVTISGSVLCDKNTVYILDVSISDHEHFRQIVRMRLLNIISSCF